MANVFVTGGSGFLGRNLITALTAHGDRVRALARSAAAAAEIERRGAEVVKGDLDDEESLRRGMQSCDVVYHAAALAEAWGRPADFYRVNVAGTEQVLRAARSAGVPRLVHVSTEAVLLGGPPIINVDEQAPRPARPTGLYATTKGLAEDRVLAANSAELATIVVRPRFIWGNDDTTLLAQLVKAVRSGQFMWIDGGHFPISTCHVTNVCEGLLLAAEHGQGGQIYFLTDGEPVEFRGFVTALLHTQGIDPGSRSIPHWLANFTAHVAETAWNIFHLPGTPVLTRTMVKLIGEQVTVNDAKARRELGYVGSVSREEGLETLRRG